MTFSEVFYAAYTGSPWSDVLLRWAAQNPGNQAMIDATWAAGYRGHILEAVSLIREIVDAVNAEPS